MNTIAFYRRLLQSAHELLEGTVDGVTASQLVWDPPGRAFSIAANYAHVLTSEDMTVHRLLADRELLATSTWAGRIGADELPPLGPGGDLKAWGARTKPDLAALRAYGQAVYAATDAYLATLPPEGLHREIDLSAFGLGRRDVGFLLTAILANCALHTGEISCLKGLQGTRGYPL